MTIEGKLRELATRMHDYGPGPEGLVDILKEAAALAYEDAARVVSTEPFAASRLREQAAALRGGGR